MHAYYRNHQLYLAERAEWLDRHIAKASKKAIIKIKSWKSVSQAREEDQIRLVSKLVKDSLLNIIPNKTILTKEGFFITNLSN